MECLNGLTSLESLWLGKNKIEKIENISGLLSLKQLDVQSNRLTAISGISTLSNLRELYLASNAISSVDGIPQFGTLNTIDLSRNKLKDLSSIEIQTELEDLWLSSNCVDDYAAIEPLKCLPKLTTLYLEHNPIAADYQYRIRLTSELPSLEYLDATMTSPHRTQSLQSGSSTSVLALGSLKCEK